MLATLSSQLVRAEPAGIGQRKGRGAAEVSELASQMRIKALIQLTHFVCSREALVAGAVGYNVDNVNEFVARGKLGNNNAGNLSPTSLKSEDADPAFWVPASVTASATAVQQQVSHTTEESAPPTPTSPTGSFKSNTLSYCSTASVPIARSDKHVVLAMHPSRPRVSSMNAKLDHTKIDMTLYRSVSILYEKKLL